jgi:hypothetical protein
MKYNAYSQGIFWRDVGSFQKRPLFKNEYGKKLVTQTPKRKRKSRRKHPRCLRLQPWFFRLREIQGNCETKAFNVQTAGSTHRIAGLAC